MGVCDYVFRIAPEKYKRVLAHWRAEILNRTGARQRMHALVRARNSEHQRAESEHQRAESEHQRAGSLEKQLMITQENLENARTRSIWVEAEARRIIGEVSEEYKELTAGLLSARGHALPEKVLAEYMPKEAVLACAAELLAKTDRKFGKVPMAIFCNGKYIYSASSEFPRFGISGSEICELVDMNIPMLAGTTADDEPVFVNYKNFSLALTPLSRQNNEAICAFVIPNSYTRQLRTSIATRFADALKKVVDYLTKRKPGHEPETNLGL
jgi:hypothetical protein